jgi:hypothetical protein
MLISFSSFNHIPEFDPEATAEPGLDEFTLPWKLF